MSVLWKLPWSTVVKINVSGIGLGANHNWSFTNRSAICRDIYRMSSYERISQSWGFRCHRLASPEVSVLGCPVSNTANMLLQLQAEGSAQPVLLSDSIHVHFR